MVFPSSECSSFQSWARSLFDTINQKEEGNQNEGNEYSRTRSFVERLLEDELKDSRCAQSISPPPVQHCSWNLLTHLKGNYAEKKGTHLGVHWQMLKNW